MRLIVARHGETEWNAQNKVLGRTNISLNEKGRNQASELGESVRKYGIKEIYTSPLDRSIETGMIVSDIVNAPLLIKEELIEQDFGIYEGINRFDKEYQNAKRLFAIRYPGGESYFDVAARVYPFIYELRQQHNDIIMIITHGGICRIINSFFEGLQNEDFATFAMPNCGYKEYEL